MAVHPRDPETTDPPLSLDPPLLGPIGIVRLCEPGEKPGATIIDPSGTPHDAESLGWDHGA